MSAEESVTTWLAHLKAGRSDAAHEIWHRYVEQLVRLARRKLGRTPRRAADEEDVVLSAFEGFLAGVDDGRFLRLEDRDDLWQVLVMLTERRAIALRRRERALKRGAGDVRGESVFAHHEGNGSLRRGLDQTSGREASPDFAAGMTEQLRFLLEQLRDEVQRQIALGKLEGKTNKELSTNLGISLRTVERKLAIIRHKWRGESCDE
jgi:DNA-directed RNA polymerase specialized sigma24 family protein